MMFSIACNISSSVPHLLSIHTQVPLKQGHCVCLFKLVFEVSILHSTI